MAKPIRHWRTVLVPIIAATILAGCDDAGQNQAKRARPFDMPPEQCLSTLTDRGITYQSLPPLAGNNGCGIPTPVALSALDAALSQPATLGCPLAVRLDDFDQKILQPLSIRYFGQKVQHIHHYGAYACRNQIGGNPDRLSEHALGRAIDISAFQLDDGTMIRVKQDWNGIGRRSRFLRNIAREACDLFHVVLTPSHDTAHQDHLHLDTGPWRLCAT